MTNQPESSLMGQTDLKKFIIIAAVIGIVLVLLLGGVTAFTVLSSNKGHDSDTKKEQTQTQKKETSTENAKKKKSAEKSAISVMVTADGAAEDSKAFERPSADIRTGT